jgi:hypothetical protein
VRDDLVDQNDTDLETGRRDLTAATLGRDAADLAVHPETSSQAAPPRASPNRTLARERATSLATALTVRD